MPISANCLYSLKCWREVSFYLTGSHHLAFADAAAMLWLRTTLLWVECCCGEGLCRALVKRTLDAAGIIKADRLHVMDILQCKCPLLWLSSSSRLQFNRWSLLAMPPHEHCVYHELRMHDSDMVATFPVDLLNLLSLLRHWHGFLEYVIIVLFEGCFSTGKGICFNTWHQAEIGN